MPQTCPHCGIRLPAVVDAYCPECREELPESLSRPVAPTSRRRPLRLVPALALVLVAVAGFVFLFPVWGDLLAITFALAVIAVPAAAGIVIGMAGLSRARGSKHST